jgi:hypothetical protein
MILRTKNQPRPRREKAMQLAKLINKLHKEGYHATRGRIRSAMSNGYLDPLPRKVARGAYDFSRRNLKQIRWYFVNVRPGPRPNQLSKHPVDGSHDRICRLERKQEWKLEQKSAEAQRAAFRAGIDELEILASQWKRCPKSMGG